MQATEITRYADGAVKFAFEGEKYLMDREGSICWATPGGWVRMTTDREAFPRHGSEYNRGTAYANTDQTFAGTITPKS